MSDRLKTVPFDRLSRSSIKMVVFVARARMHNIKNANMGRFYIHKEMNLSNVRKSHATSTLKLKLTY